MTNDRNTRNLSVLIRADSEATSETVAEIFAETIARSPASVLGLATGGTPVETYRRLIRRHRDGGLDFSQVTTFNLDEYVGLGPEHPQSYRAFMREHLFDHVNLIATNTHVPDGITDRPDEYGGRYEAEIAAAGGIDVQLLGIGHNGHIAFNEPGSSRSSRTRLVELAPETIQKNARFFDSIDEVPRTAITMGIETILEAKRIVMLATGAGKAEAIRDALEGPIDEACPASLLQEHPNVTFVLDEAAASALSEAAR